MLPIITTTTRTEVNVLTTEIVRGIVSSEIDPDAQV